MQIKVKGKAVYTYSVRRLVYALCFFFFCVIDQRCKTYVGKEVFQDLTGIGMAVILLSHFRWKDLLKWKIPYLAWTAVWLIGAPISYFYRYRLAMIPGEWPIVVLDVILFGYIILYTVIRVAIEKKYPRLDKRTGILWLAMMLWMILSRSNYFWPVCYLAMFGCFYLADFSAEEREDLFQGMLDGIILGFFVLQGFCFVFRPYDVARYKGVYSNCNQNAQFYLYVLAAVYAKIIYVTRSGSNKWIKLYYWMGAGAALSLELLTIGRTGWMTAVLLSLAFFHFFRKHQPSVRAWKNLLKLCAFVIIAFPLTFGAVRYLPPLFHHPVWFEGEWRPERVHSWDPWDSEKYIDLNEYAAEAWGRILGSFEDLLEHSPFLLVTEAEELSGEESAILASEQDSLLVRGAIYKHYLQNLNLLGHSNGELGFLLTPTYWVPHAHNIFLQYGSDFGVPVMVMLAALFLCGGIRLWRRYSRTGSETDAGSWMFLLLPAIFGMFEYSWGTGSLSTLLMFMAWRKVICDGEK